MDPNANLKRQRELVRQIHDCRGTVREDIVDELADLVEALDDWLCRKGFLPTDWLIGDR